MAEGYPDWFKRTGAETFFARNLLPLAGQKLDFLQIGRLKVFKGTSDEFFSSDEGKRGFHFIYIDGNHEAAQVLKDGLNAIYRTGIGGIVAFDDYMWTLGKGLWADPKPAVDAIYYCHSNKLEVIDKGVQVWLKRTSL
jgi:hypothetical protein